MPHKFWIVTVARLLTAKRCFSMAALLAWTLSIPLAPYVVAAPTAPTFTVNSLADVVASAPLDNGVCETAPGNGVCTLRAAIMKANHFPGGGATINVPANSLPYKLTIAPREPTMKRLAT